MYTNPYQICSQALIKLGATPISSFREQSRQAQLCAYLYEQTLKDLLSAHPWSFATNQKKLLLINKNNNNHFSYIHQAPYDLLRVLSVVNSQHQNEKGREYRIQEDKILTKIPNVILSYIAHRKEKQCPAFFLQALIDRLAAHMAFPLMHKISLKKECWREAEISFKKARLIDSQQQPHSSFENFVLISHRNQA